MDTTLAVIVVIEAIVYWFTVLVLDCIDDLADIRYMIGRYVKDVFTGDGESDEDEEEESEDYYGE